MPSGVLQHGELSDHGSGLRKEREAGLPPLSKSPACLDQRGSQTQDKQGQDKEAGPASDDQPFTPGHRL
ncbi:MAG TPA: hypothetical protein VNJ71_11910 [Gemmatimonadales bacterium]|nr:hypothetical protein [Gemmatimonadales bacterium]